jgi:hypothetical protein
VSELVLNHSPSPLDASFDLGAWKPSIDLAVQTGAAYSTAHPITEPESANTVGQRYHGPVVLVTDALCYSATDMFAAGFQDHDIGPIVGIADATGAGGANVWTHELLRLLLDVTGNNPLRPLPHGAGMRVAIRRTVRVGRRAGTPVEDLGVVPDVRHRMTRDDVLGSNQDLIAAAAAQLAGRPAYVLDGRVTVEAGKAAVRITTGNLDRVDMAFDDRWIASIDVTDGTRTRRPTAPVPACVRLAGYAAGELVAVRNLVTPS